MPREDCTPISSIGKADDANEWEVRIPLSKLTEAAKLPNRILVLLLAIESFARCSDVCWPTNATLGEMLEKDPRNIRSAFAELAELGYVRRETSDDGRSFIRILRRISTVARSGGGEDEIIRGGRMKSSSELLHKEELIRGRAPAHAREDKRTALQTRAEAVRMVRERIAVNVMSSRGDEIPEDAA